MRQSRYYCVIPPYYIKNRRIIRSLILKINVGLEPTILSTQKTYVLTTIQIHRSKTIFRYRFYFFRHKKEIHYIPLSCTTVNQALPTVSSSVFYDGCFLRFEFGCRTGFEPASQWFTVTAFQPIKLTTPYKRVNHCPLYVPISFSVYSRHIPAQATRTEFQL